MSWESFKRDMKILMDNPQNVTDIDKFAETFANSYDNAIRRGGDLVNKVKLLRGNKQALQTFTKIALFNGLNSKTSSFNLVSELGKGVIMYWTGGEMRLNPIPILPAPGSIQNQQVISNRVLNPGQWPQVPPIPPNTSTDILLDIFILTARIHLLQVSGVAQTISLYPPNGTPAPGFVSWTGYLV